MLSRLALAVFMALSPLAAKAAIVTHSAEETWIDEVWSGFPFVTLPRFDLALGALKTATLQLIIECLVEADHGGATGENTGTTTQLAAQIHDGWINFGGDDITIPDTIVADEVSCLYPSSDCSGSLSAKAEYILQQDFSDAADLALMSGNDMLISAILSDEWYTAPFGPGFLNGRLNSRVSASITYDYQPAAVPLPPALPLLAGSLAGVLFLRKRQTRKA